MRALRIRLYRAAEGGSNQRGHELHGVCLGPSIRRHPPAALGYAIIYNSTLALVRALFVSTWFLLVPFAEESWCRENPGSAYEAYAAVVPRSRVRGL